MRNPPWWRRAWDALWSVARADDRRADALTAATVFVLGGVTLLVGFVGLYADPPVVPLWWHVALLAVGCLLILVKRSSPVRALAGGVAIMAVDLWWGGSLAVVLVLWDLLYAAATWARPRARQVLWALAWTLLVVAAVASAVVQRDPRAFVGMALQVGAIVVMPLWWATNVRQKAELGEARKHEAVRAERAAMARDLHDAVAAHLSTVAIHSGAALAAPPDTARDRAALEQVRAASLASLEEMRTMILLLRAEPARSDDVAAPGRLTGARALDDLVERARAAGSPVRLATPVGLGALPAAVDQALYRIVQEALTNAVKHATGADVEVRLGRGGDDVEVVVANAAGRGAPAPAGTGSGLLGMRERAEALGGELTAGPTPDGGWSVAARLPLRVGAA